MKNLILVITIALSTSVFSNVLLRDVGVIGLASHDMFSWDRKAETNTENGRLDLSTIFDFENGKRWKKGGDPKNGENAPVWTITKNIVDYHKNQLRNHTWEQARINSVIYFHKMIKNSFERLTGTPFPQEAMNLDVTNVEQAAMRALHDILPGKAKLFRATGPKEFKLTGFFNRKKFLNENEMNQELKYFDGDYDQEYKEIPIPFTSKKINLKEVDGKFIEKYSSYKQQEMLEELALVGKGILNIQDVSFIHHIEELFSKGICNQIAGEKVIWITEQPDC